MKAVAAFLLVLCHLAVTQAWTCDEGPRLYDAYQVDAGNGMVVARDRYNYPYLLIGSSWKKLGYTRLTHITAGEAGIWGAYYHRVYKFVAGNFVSAYGVHMQQLDAGGDDHLVGSSTYNYAYCLTGDRALGFNGAGNLSWTYLSMRVKYASCSPNYGCWAVDTSYRVYFTETITSMCARTTWTYVSGIRMKTIEVATDGTVLGVATNGRAYQRTGISSSHPRGTSWITVTTCMSVRSVSYDLGYLWVVSNGGILLKCIP